MRIDVLAMHRCTAVGRLHDDLYVECLQIMLRHFAQVGELGLGALRDLGDGGSMFNSRVGCRNRASLGRSPGLNCCCFGTAKRFTSEKLELDVARNCSMNVPPRSAKPRAASCRTSMSKMLPTLRKLRRFASNFASATTHPSRLNESLSRARIDWRLTTPRWPWVKKFRLTSQESFPAERAEPCRSANAASVSSKSSPAERPSACAMRKIMARVGMCSPRSIFPMCDRSTPAV